MNSILCLAFTGLGAPYWNSTCRGILSGIDRTTGKNEIVRACLESIAYQICDVINVMGADAGVHTESLRVDGGPTKNTYLMQFQSDMLDGEFLYPQRKKCRESERHMRQEPQWESFRKM